MRVEILLLLIAAVVCALNLVFFGFSSLQHSSEQIRQLAETRSARCAARFFENLNTLRPGCRLNKAACFFCTADY